MVKDPSDMDLDTAFNVFDEKLLPLCIKTLPQVGGGRSLMHGGWH